MHQDRASQGRREEGEGSARHIAEVEAGKGGREEMEKVGRGTWAEGPGKTSPISIRHPRSLGQ